MQTIVLGTGLRGKTGGYGSYFQISASRGVKLLKYSRAKTAREVKESAYMADAKMERDLLRSAQKSGLTPKCYGVAIVKRGHWYYAGIIMQHLGTRTLASLRLGWRKNERIIEKMNTKLEAKGIYLTDLHRKNIMKHKGKFYAIDFSPDYASVA